MGLRLGDADRAGLGSIATAGSGPQLDHSRSLRAKPTELNDCRDFLLHGAFSNHCAMAAEVATVEPFSERQCDVD